MTKIELGKTYRTRDGREVRIYAVDHYGYYCVAGAVLEGGAWKTASWAATGRLNTGGSEHPDDLIEVRPRIKREVWLNVYPDRQACHSEKGAADHHRSPDAIACVKLTIDCEEGEGL